MQEEKKERSTEERNIYFLLKKDSHWQWQPEQATAFRKLKQAISSSPVLKFFDPSRPSVGQADASSTGLGACLLQDGRPVAYASRSLSAAEENYAQIEKEMFGVIFALEKFHHDVYGYKTEVQTHHQPRDNCQETTAQSFTKASVDATSTYAI